MAAAWYSTNAEAIRPCSISPEATIDNSRPGEYTRGVALEFDQISGFSRFMLEQSLRYLPPAPPYYRPGRRDTSAIFPQLVGNAAAA